MLQLTNVIFQCVLLADFWPRSLCQTNLSPHHSRCYSDC